MVIVPTSCLGQWKSELETWTTLNVVEYHGNAASREIIRQNEFYFSGKRNTVLKFHVLLTTYEMLTADVSILGKFDWNYIVLDEAHRIKVPTRQYPLTSTEYRICALQYPQRVQMRPIFATHGYSHSKQHEGALDDPPLLGPEEI